MNDDIQDYFLNINRIINDIIQYAYRNGLLVRCSQKPTTPFDYIATFIVSDNNNITLNFSDSVDLSHFSFKHLRNKWLYKIKSIKNKETASMDSKFEVKDSGKREEFQGGATRDTSEDKSRPDLISPFFVERLGMHMAKGAKKYSPWNWALGIPNSRCLESLHRHIMQFEQGDRSEDHLCAAVANLMFMIHNEEVKERGIEMISVSDGLVNRPMFQIKKGE